MPELANVIEYLSEGDVEGPHVQRFPSHLPYPVIIWMSNQDRLEDSGNLTILTKDEALRLAEIIQREYGSGE